jgi:hypothetical protein
VTTRRRSPTRDLRLSIGGLVGHVELSGAVAPFLDQLHARYAAFLLPASAAGAFDFSLRLELESGPPPGTRDGWATARAHPLTVTSSARSIDVDRWDFSARLRAEGRGRNVRCRGRGRAEMNPFAVDCLMRALWATILPAKRGLLVHGCGLRHAQIGVVFPGQSGAGKTTLARKAPDADDVLSDELCVLRRMDDGWRVHGTPFWGDFARGGVSMRSWPLRTLAFLAKAPRDTVTMTPIVSAEATLRLLSCYLAFATDLDTVKRNLDVAIQLCAEVRTVEASLTKDVPAPSIFRKLGPHLGPEVIREVPPANAREAISDLRWRLQSRRTYAFRPRRDTASWLGRGQSLLVEAARASDFVAGDVALYWIPGASADGDRLVCQRVGDKARKAGKKPLAERTGEVLGKVMLVSADGRTRSLPNRVEQVSRAFGTLMTAPLAQATRTVEA